MTLLLLCAPWVMVGLYVFLLVRSPPRLPVGSTDSDPRAVPFVSVIVPARNEEARIGRCVTSLTASAYPSFEVIVVDDESEDGTADVVRALARGNALDLRVLSGSALPDGWFGKPWACGQGAQVANGALLLFTDADTVHGPGLLGRAVAGMEEAEADVLSIIGHQVMETFWEKLLQPQFFMLLALRYPRAGSVKPPGRWRDAIANGQFLLFRRSVYEQLGGHQPVRGEVVEDLRMAQHLVRNGFRLVVRGDEDLQTRMYTSLGALVRGWSKNVATAALQTTPRWVRPWILPVSLLVGTVLWLVPPAALAWALAVGARGTVPAWAGVVTSFDALLWMAASRVMKGNPLHGLLYPIGAALAGYIVSESWIRGARIHWKGRHYRMPRETRLGEGVEP